MQEGRTRRSAPTGFIVKIIFILAALLALCGCSDRQVYDSLQGAKQNDCNKIADNNERERCFAAANQSYDRYEQERNELKH